MLEGRIQELVYLVFCYCCCCSGTIAGVFRGYSTFKNYFLSGSGNQVVCQESNLGLLSAMQVSRAGLDLEGESYPVTTQAGCPSPAYV